MKYFKFIVLAFFCSISSNAQQVQGRYDSHIGATCKLKTSERGKFIDPKENLGDNKTIKINKAGRAIAATGVTGFVESIHAAVVNWESGDFDWYSIGTAPGVNGATQPTAAANIRWGQMLRTGDYTTFQHSYNELRDNAALPSHYPAPMTFSLGQNFYFNMYDTANNVTVVGPLKFVWEDLGNTNNNVVANVVGSYGLGLGGFTVAQQNKMRQFYDLVIPILKEVYGAPAHGKPTSYWPTSASFPANTHTINVTNDAAAVGSNTFYSGPNRVSCQYAVNGNGDLDQPRLMVHEMVHAFRDNVGISSSADGYWNYDPVLDGFEESMAEGVALIVMDIFTDRYPSFFVTPEFHKHWANEGSMEFDWDYDFQNHSQLTNASFWSADQGMGQMWERYGTGAAAIYKMYIEDNQILKKFNAEYYRRMNANHNLVPSRALCVDIFKTIKTTMEEDPIETWINNQRIYDCSVLPGKKVHMLSFQGNGYWGDFGHDNRISIIETQNNHNGDDWGYDVEDASGNLIQRWYHQLNNLPGTLTIRRYNGTSFSPTNMNNQAIAPSQIKNNMSSVAAGGTWSGPHQGPCTPAIGINGGGSPNCFPTGIDSHDVYTTSADLNNTNGGSINNSNWYTSIANNEPASTRPNRVLFGLHETGLYRYEIAFNDNGTITSGKYYRLQGDGFIGKTGVYGGVRNNADTPVTGKFVIEQKVLGEEPLINVNNGTLVANRIWASVPETDPYRQAGRTDRKYSKQGKVHAIFISSDCTKQKIAFRTINYGSPLNGVQMFLFNIDDMKDIVFTPTPNIVVCVGGSANFTVSNNFPSYLDTDTRITYKWKNPSGTVVSTIKDYVIPSVLATQGGNYTLEITFFGCVLTKTVSLTIAAPFTPSVLAMSPPDCSSTTGTIQLTGLPTTSWVISGAPSSPISGNTSTTTISGLIPGIYSFTVTSGGCSSAIASVTLGDNGTTWNGTAWSNGVPNLTTKAMITGNYNTTSLNSIDACSLTVNNNAIVTVTSGKYIQLQNYLSLSTGSTFTVEHDGSLIQIDNTATNTINGTFNLERKPNIRKSDYVYWSSPVNIFSSSSISPTTSTGYIFKWLPTVNTNLNGFGIWANSIENMIVGKGYIVRGPDNFNNVTAQIATSRFIGSPNNGILNTPITRGIYDGANYTGPTSTIVTKDEDNWNLIGNPYPSSIKAIDFLNTNTNIAGFIKIWTHGTLPSIANPEPFYQGQLYNYTPMDYLTYNASGSSSGPGTFNGNIASGQGFFVLMNHTSASAIENITFNNSLRSPSYSNDQFTKNNQIVNEDNIERNRIWLDILNNTNDSTMRTMVGYVEGATNGNDRLFDAVGDIKLKLNIYSLINEELMVIQARKLPFDNNDKITLGYSTPSSGEFKIGIGALDGLFTNTSQEIYLEDKLLNVTHNLRNNSYNFISNVGRFDNRFLLKFKNNNSNTTDFNNSNQVVIYGENNIVVKSSRLNIKDVVIYDVLGKTLFTGNNLNEKELIMNKFQPSTSVLFVKVTLEDNSIVIKKLIY